MKMPARGGGEVGSGGGRMTAGEEVVQGRTVQAATVHAIGNGL